MKTVCYTCKRASLSQVFLILLCTITFTTKAQTYYSNFDSPAGNYSVSSPSGADCIAPSISDGSNIADSNLDNYTGISGLLSATLLCTDDLYSIRSKINFASSGLIAAPANSYAGYFVQFNTTVSLAVLQDNLRLITYKAGVPQDTSTSSSLINLDLLSAGEPVNIYFQTSNEFDEVQLLFNTAVLPLNIAFDYRFFYASAIVNPIVLPVKLTDFSAQLEGQSIKVNWRSTSEQNLVKYDVERSFNSNKFVSIGTVPAKGGSTEAAYSFTDKPIVAGDVYYRLKMVNRDGSVEYSRIVLIKNETVPKWKVYPTVLNSGTDITISLSTDGTTKLQLQLANLQGQIVRNASVSNSKVVMPVSGLSSGIYILKLFQNGQMQAQQKIIIQNK